MKHAEPADGATAVRWLRLRAQRLDDATRALPARLRDVIHAVGGVQAQDEHAALLGLRARRLGVTAEDLAAARRPASRREPARGSGPSIVRTWCMRGTLHLVPADLLADLLAVFGPVHVARGRRRLAQLGLDEVACARGVAVIAEVLASRGALTRHALAEAVRDHGVPLDVTGQAPVHLIRRACLQGVACQVGAPDGSPRYGLREHVAPAPLPERRSALGRIGRWYLDAFAPASPDDLAAWSGLPAADVRHAWRHAGDLVAVARTDPPLWRRADGDARADGDPLTVRLLPAFDGYLLGYRDRRHVLARDHAHLVNAGGGMVRPTLVVGGRVTGTWRIDRARARLLVTTFAGLAGVPLSGLDAEVDDVGRCLGLNLTVAVVGGPAHPGAHPTAS